jgi:AraC-like DNA-binding protein
MLTLPIPAIAALVLAFLGLRARLRGETPMPLLALIGACALQAAVVAGNQHYGLPGFAVVQPVLALCLPPLAWVAFVATVRRPLASGDLWHVTIPVFGAFFRAFAPWWVLDQWIVLVFLAYGGMVLWSLRGIADLAHARLGAGERPLRLWRWIGVALMVSALSDMVIPVMLALGHADWVRWLVTAFSSATLFALGLLGVQDEMAAVAEPEVAPVATEGDADLVAAMERLMTDKQLWLDPDLTLSRIARRMMVPAKTLSSAINRVRGENVSRVVNGWRIGHACTLLLAGESVTSAMLSSGFNTKSNFNREFLRVQGMAPRDWVEKYGTGPQDVVDNTGPAAI